LGQALSESPEVFELVAGCQVQANATFLGLTKGELKLREKTTASRDGNGHAAQFTQQLVTSLDRDAAAATDGNKNLKKALLTVRG
jgi:hypothetical protein